MTSEPPRVTVDSSVFLNVLIGGDPENPAWLAAGQRLFHAGERGEIDILASAISLAEVAGSGKVRGAHLPPRDRHDRSKRAQVWMRGPGFGIVEVDRHLATAAGDLAILHQLTGPDAIILASAIRTSSTALYTWDHDLLKLNGKIPVVRVLKPSEGSFGQDLFDSHAMAAH